MPVDEKFVGREYGPYKYEVCIEKIREFANAILSENKLYFDEDAAKAAGYPTVVAPPTFAVVFNFEPFKEAVLDPEIGIPLYLLVHAGQRYEFIRPVYAREELTTRGKIVSIENKPGKTIFTVESESFDSEGNLVVRGIYTALIRG